MHLYNTSQGRKFIFSNVEINFYHLGVLPRMPTNKTSPYLENCAYLEIIVRCCRWLGTSLVTQRSDGARADRYTRTQTEQSGNETTKTGSGESGRAQCMRMSRIDMGLDYDGTVMVTCKLTRKLPCQLRVHR